MSIQQEEKTNRFKQFHKWLKGYYRYYFVAILLLIVLQYFRTLLPLFFQFIVNTVLDNKESELPMLFQRWVTAPTIKETLFNVGLLYAGFAAIRVILMFFRRLSNGVFMEKVAYRMRNRLYSKLQDLSFSYHTHAETGDLIQRCTTDVEAFRVFVGEQLVEVFRLLFLITFSIIQMTRINATMMFYSVVLTPVIFITAFVYFRNVKSRFKLVEEAEAKMTTALQESVTGIRVVKAFAKEKYEIEKFNDRSKEYLKEDFKLLRLMAIFWGGTDFIVFGQYALAITMGIIMAVNGEIDPGDFPAYLMYIAMIVWPMRQLGRIVSDFGKTTVSLDRLDGIDLELSEHEYDSQEKPEIVGKVEFENVSFQFEDDEKALLKGISFTVNKGETVAIVGRTGSGKSTLINLMVRLLDYQGGSIKFDGNDIRNINKKHLRENVGIIMQEPFLYSRTVYDNIGIMDKNANQERIYQAASIASVHEDISNFEEGYNTVVGERGVTLSGGQKQRVAIARMLIHSKPVLIFDDSLSAVDTETDIQIRNALNEFWSNTTVFIITHRITTAMEADKIIVLDKGEISEMGTHQELMDNNGIYRDLWEIQSNVEYDYQSLNKEDE